MGYEIGPRIRKYREAINLSQKDFAQQIGVSNNRVSNWETGLNRPDVDLLAIICQVLKVPPDELLDIRLSPEDMSEQEKRLIKAYRAKPELQSAVNILLSVEESNDG